MGHEGRARIEGEAGMPQALEELEGALPRMAKCLDGGLGGAELLQYMAASQVGGCIVWMDIHTINT